MKVKRIVLAALLGVIAIAASSCFFRVNTPQSMTPYEAGKEPCPEATLESEPGLYDDCNRKIYYFILAKAGEGEPQALFKLGLWDYEGWPYESNFTAAAHNFEEAARKGHARASFYLGLSYLNGQGLEKNYEQAAAWLRKAAGQGLPEAQLKLGDMCVLGQGGAQDISEAEAWFDAAVKNLEGKSASDGFAKIPGMISHCRLLTRKFMEAEQAARQGLALDCTEEWVSLDLAHALLMQDREQEALDEYRWCVGECREELAYGFVLLSARFPEKADRIRAVAGRLMMEVPEQVPAAPAH